MTLASIDDRLNGVWQHCLSPAKNSGYNRELSCEKILLEKLFCKDHAAIPDFSAGAMENWGLVLYREAALLHDENMSSAANKYWVSLVVAHEIAHTVSCIPRAISVAALS